MISAPPLPTKGYRVEVAFASGFVGSNRQPFAALVTSWPGEPLATAVSAERIGYGKEFIFVEPPGDLLLQYKGECSPFWYWPLEGTLAPLIPAAILLACSQLLVGILLGHTHLRKAAAATGEVLPVFVPEPPGEHTNVIKLQRLRRECCPFWCHGRGALRRSVCR